MVNSICTTTVFGFPGTAASQPLDFGFVGNFREMLMGAQRGPSKLLKHWSEKLLDGYSITGRRPNFCCRGDRNCGVFKLRSIRDCFRTFVDAPIFSSLTPIGKQFDGIGNMTERYS